MPDAIPELYRCDRFIARRQVFRLFGAGFTISNLDGGLLASSDQKAFRLKEDIRVAEGPSGGREMEDIRVAEGPSGGREILRIQADRIIDFDAAYRVTDAIDGEVIGMLRRKGWSSLFRDTWEILDASGIIRGRVIEDSGWKAAVRRFVEHAAPFLPQTFHIEVEGRVVGTMSQNFNPFVEKYFVDLTRDDEALLPRPLAVATVILLLAIEGRQR